MVGEPPANLFPDLARLRKQIRELRLTTPLPFDREPDLLALAPIAEAKMAAIVMLARTVRRRTWSEDVETSEHAFPQLGSSPPPLPGVMASAEYRYREGDARRGVCTFCAATPGKGLCTQCRGTRVRQVLDAEGHYVEGECVCGDGMSACAYCGGSHVTMRAKVIHVSDEAVWGRRAFVPTLQGGLHKAIREEIESIEQLPESCRVDLTARIGASPYRSAAGVAKPDFFGWDYVDAYERARTSVIVTSTSETVFRTDEVWAWPFLCVRWMVEGTSVDVAIIPQPDGSMRPVFPPS